MEVLNRLIFSYTFLSLLASLALANVVLIGNNATVSFDDIEATFAPGVKGPGECGVLHLAEPINGCSQPKTPIARVNESGCPPFVLVLRGGCSFEEKVRIAQSKGFKAAIVYDNEDDGVLVSMAGNSDGINIYAVFVSRASGEALKNYAGVSNVELWIIPSFENSAWSIMAISFISLLAMSAVLATCFFVRRHRIRRERPRTSRVREFHGMSSRLVKAMPSLIFTSVLDESCTSSTCAICLEDYSVGDKLRVLPCRHKFHSFCVDSWLTSWRTFCPVCKRDARTRTGDPPASECTPLLSSSAASLASSSVLSSFRSSFASSSAIEIVQAMSQSRSGSRVQSLSGTPYNQQSFRSYRQSPPLSISRSSVDVINTSSQRSNASHLASAYSLGYPSISPSTRFMSVYIPNSRNASPSYLGSSAQQLPPLHYSSSTQQIHPLYHSESAASFSPFASAQSLPGC